MELRQLTYFLAVVEEGGFTRAAAREHVAQPGVSAQIGKLERELGHDLFDRTSRTVRLTQAGEVLLPYARTALKAAADARLALDELAGLLRGRVRVGVLTATPSDDLVHLLAEFHEAHPAVEISLREDASDRLIEGILAGSIDLAWVSTSGNTPTGLESIVLTEQELVAAVAPHDPLAEHDTIHLTALRDRALGSLPAGTGIRGALESACATAGFTPRVAFEASAPDVLAKLATRGMGVAVIPRLIADRHTPAVHVVTLTHPVPRGRVELAWRAGGPLSPPARALAERVRAALRVSAPGLPA
ncbi:LysR family transcriptional regulator [Actinokineospora enzanensis]|uniref:LysR family transcriptional regulator n=1 Tax=Actinokineospora enzanensis TaxID=155975 RepID=UPI00036664A1|nr:LysR substrate-binding domain-containing protein [Actinokineospora enzanensis]